MTNKEKKVMEAKLALMDANERAKVFREAAQLRKQSRQKAGVSKRPPRLLHDDDEEELVFIKARRQENALDEWVWRILSTEQTEELPPLGAVDGLQGTVVTVTQRTCEAVVRGRRVACLLPPSLIEKRQSDLAVGDEVVLDPKPDGISVVQAVLPRRTKLSRPDPLNANRERVIVANVDTVVIVVSVVAPPLHPRLIDRYLIATRRGGARPVICVNKLDLITSDEELRSELRQLDPYRALEVPVLRCSAVRAEGMTELLRELSGQVAAFVGHSGVGKSSLVNALRPELELETGEVSAGYGRGTHTTTASSLWEVGDGTKVIDTPGIRTFGLWSLTVDELPYYFPEFGTVGRCKFNDCSHTHEPACAVKNAVERGEISGDRYDTYLRILGTL